MFNIYTMKTIKKDLLDDIYRPDFLNGGEVSDFTWSCINNILSVFINAVSEKILTNRQVNMAIKNIENTAEELDFLANENQVLLSWIYITTMVEKWIETVADLEYFEAASNLKKILDGIYKS